MKIKFALLVATILLSSYAATAQKKTPGKADPWASLHFLIGSWEANTTGGIAQGKTARSYSFRFELHEHILARHSSIGFCPNPDDFDCAHNDLLYIYPGPDGKGFQAIYFDNSGHVIRYDITTKANSAVFLSDPSLPGPQYRLTYQLVEGTMNGILEVKMPNQGDFSSMLEWSGKRR